MNSPAKWANVPKLPERAVIELPEVRILGGKMISVSLDQLLLSGVPKFI